MNSQSMSAANVAIYVFKTIFVVFILEYINQKGIQLWKSWFSKSCLILLSIGIKQLLNINAPIKMRIPTFAMHIIKKNCFC